MLVVQEAVAAAWAVQVGLVGLAVAMEEASEVVTEVAEAEAQVDVMVVAMEVVAMAAEAKAAD